MRRAFFICVAPFVPRSASQAPASRRPASMAGPLQTALVCEVLTGFPCLPPVAGHAPQRPRQSNLGGMPAATLRGTHLKQFLEKLAQIANKPAEHAGNPAPPSAAIDIKDLNRQASDATARRTDRHDPEARCASPRAPGNRFRGAAALPRADTTILRYFPRLHDGGHQPAAQRPSGVRPGQPQRTRRGRRQIIPSTTLPSSVPPPQRGRRAHAPRRSQGADSSRSTRKSSMERRIRGIWRREA